jgi:hypothetical protein
MSQTQNRRCRKDVLPRLEALEDRTAPAVLAVTPLSGESHLTAQLTVGSAHNDQDTHEVAPLAWGLLKNVVAAVEAIASTSTSAQVSSTTPVAALSLGVTAGTTVAAEESSQSASPSVTTTGSLSSAVVSTTATLSASASTAKAPLSDVGTGGGDGSTGGTKGTTVAPTVTPPGGTAAQGAPAGVEHASAAATDRYFLSVLAASGAGSGSREVESEGTFASGEGSGRGAVLAVEALAGQTADGNVEADESAAPPSPAALDLADGGDLPADGAGQTGAVARADILPQSGERLSVAATALTGGEAPAGDTSGNLRADLFIGPLDGSLAAGALPSTDSAAADFTLPDGAGGGVGVVHGIALVTVGLAGAVVWGMQRKTPEEEKADLVRM